MITFLKGDIAISLTFLRSLFCVNVYLSQGQCHIFLYIFLIFHTQRKSKNILTPLSADNLVHLAIGLAYMQISFKICYLREQVYKTTLNDTPTFKTQSLFGFVLILCFSYSINLKSCSIAGVCNIFSGKEQLVNILGLADHVVLVTTTQLCHDSAKVTTDSL